MKKDKRVSHKKGMSWVDIHFLNMLKVAKNEYFTVDAISSNEVAGLLVGTEIKRVREPDSWPSKYWKGMYYSVVVECPNGETRRLCCDVLKPRKTGKYFFEQMKIYKNI
jgi:hypothetical protein